MNRGGGALLERAQILSRSRSDDVDLTKWKAIIDELRSVPFNEEARAVFEEVLAAFPTAVAVWTRYAEQEMAAGNTMAVKHIFSRCLLDCPNVDLWFIYIRFIKKVNEGQGPAGVLEVRQAYDYTLDCIGHDVHSGPLWQEYLSFLAAPKPGTPAYEALWSSGMLGGQEEATRLATLRRAYQRAVVVPTHSLELIWKNYEAFENAGGNKQLGSRVLQEQRPRFQAARLAYRERKKKLEGLDPTALPLAPGKGGVSQEHQVKLWRAYLDYERSNPQRLESPQLLQRVQLAYDQSLMCLRLFPEFWYDAARWHAESGGGPQQAVVMLTKGAGALPTCLLLHFALADMEEAQGQPAEAREVYEALAKQLEQQPQQQQQQNGAGSQPGGGGPVASLPPDQQALVWIQYMRFCRRSESITASRKMFIRAKKAPSCPWQVYVASALMEWHHARERDVARRIFEKGLEIPEFLTTPQYILQYVDFLLDAGDVNNARALFERVLTEEANRKSTQLWERYLAFEFEMGDLASALTLEKRAREALGDTGASTAAGSAKGIHLLLLRYQFGDAWPCTPDQKQYLQYVMGKGPAPPGYDRRRSSKPDDGGEGGQAAAGGAGGAGGAGVGVGGMSGGEGRRLMENGGDGHGGALLRFIEMLPEASFLDGPLPNLDVVFDALLLVDDGHDGLAGTKREYEGDEDEDGVGMGQGMGARDMYRLRAKQRARLGSTDG